MPKPGTQPFTGNRDALVSYKLAVARELLLRDLAERMKAEPVLSAPGTVRDWLRLHCADLEHEVFIMLLLDAQNRLIDAHELFRGTLSQTSVYPREVVKYTLARNAAAVVFAHNHPSGVAEPSRADEVLTQNLKQALALVDVRVLDHFVVAGTSTVSLCRTWTYLNEVEHLETRGDYTPRVCRALACNLLLARKLRANIPCSVQDTLDSDRGVHGAVENQVVAIRQDAQAWSEVLARRKGQRIVENPAALRAQLPDEG